jgi:general stress protein YciG
MQQTQATPSANTRNRGFASMNAERQREIARKGGKAAHEKGTAHEFTSEEARAAGRKGGERVSADRSHMSRIGRLGGRSSAGRRQASRPEGGFPGTDGNEGNGNSPNGGETGGPDRVAGQADEMAAEEARA